MRLRTTRLLFAVALATAVIASAVSPALAAPFAAPRALMRPPAVASPLSRPAPAITPGVQERLLPIGGTLSDYVSYSGNWLDWWSLPLHGGQDMSVQVKVPRGPRMLVAIWDNDPDAEEPLAYDVGESGQTVNLGFSIPEGTASWYHIAVYCLDGSGRYTMNYDFSDPPAAADVERIYGADRVKTAIEISKATYPTGAETVVVATGWNFADALAASGLCGSYDAPLLLVRPTQLPAEVTTEIQRLGATHVFVIGSAFAVSDGVYSALQAPGRTVERLEGINRFETAAQIALKIKQNELAEGRTFTGSAFIVNGMNFPDALAVAPYAFSQRMPILPVLQNSAPSATRNALASLGTTEVIAVGGGTVVSEAVIDSFGLVKNRVWGAGRTETAEAAAYFAEQRDWASFDYVGLVTGWNFPDALGGGVNVGKNGGVLLLSKPLYLNGAPYRAIRGQNAVTKLYGSNRAISGCVIGDIDWAYYGPSPEFDESPWQE